MPVALLLFLAHPARPVQAQEPGQAGFVVQFGEERVETFCLDVPAEGAKGVDLLYATGLQVVVDVSSGIGVSLCEVEGQGCAYPAEHCFCQCMGGGECGYWNYFYRDPGAEAWTYSPLGAVLRTVLPGSVESWVWGDGHTPPDAGLTFEAICPAPAPPVTPDLPPTAQASPTSDRVMTAGPQTATPALAASETTQAPAETAEPGPDSPATASPSPAPPVARGGSPGSYLAFAAMLLLLAAVGVTVWRRRR